jgi:hypothetical protein
MLGLLATLNLSLHRTKRTLRTHMRSKSSFTKTMKRDKQTSLLPDANVNKTCDVDVVQQKEGANSLTSCHIYRWKRLDYTMFSKKNILFRFLFDGARKK